MAYSFETTPSATVKGRATTSTNSYSVKGINSSLSSVDETVEEINKVLNVFGKTMAADEYVKMTITKGAQEDE